jgi:hypothetical protein
MATVNVPWVRRTGYVLGACALVILAGCSGGFRTVPVSGTVYGQDGKPLKGGGLSFVPDPNKGNTTKVSCLARIENGHYEVASFGVKGSDASKGAPPGWYKVTLIPNLPGDNDQVTIDVPAKFKQPDTTPWSIEVVDNAPPGQYDLHMKK